MVTMLGCCTLVLGGSICIACWWFSTDIEVVKFDNHSSGPIDYTAIVIGICRIMVSASYCYQVLPKYNYNPQIVPSTTVPAPLAPAPTVSCIAMEHHKIPPVLSLTILAPIETLSKGNFLLAMKDFYTTPKLKKCVP